VVGSSRLDSGPNCLGRCPLPKLSSSQASSSGNLTTASSLIKSLICHQPYHAGNITMVHHTALSACRPATFSDSVISKLVHRMVSVVSLVLLSIFLYLRGQLGTHRRVQATLSRARVISRAQVLEEFTSLYRSVQFGHCTLMRWFIRES
jgi:hypothetical protein